MNPPKDTAQSLREQLAAIEHERWADWQRYVHSRMKKQGEEGMLMSVDDYLHWEEQIAADYSELNETEKNSDREQVARYWPLIEAYALTKANEARIDELERMNTRRHYGLSYQESLDELDEYKDKRLGDLKNKGSEKPLPTEKIEKGETE